LRVTSLIDDQGAGGSQRQEMQIDYSIVVCSDSLVRVEPMHRNSSHVSEARL